VCENNTNHVQFELNITKNSKKYNQPVSTTVGNVVAATGKGLTDANKPETLRTTKNNLHKETIKNPV